MLKGALLVLCTFLNRIIGLKPLLACFCCEYKRLISNILIENNNFQYLIQFLSCDFVENPLYFCPFLTLGGFNSNENQSWGRFSLKSL